MSDNPDTVLRALLTDECDCEDGLTLDVHPDAVGRCPKCGGRGWLPNKKTQELLDDLHDAVAYAPDVDRFPGIFIDWLEAEDAD